MDTLTFARQFPTTFARSIVEAYQESFRDHSLTIELFNTLSAALEDVDQAVDMVLESTDCHSRATRERALMAAGVRAMWLTVYQLDRLYGGPEEGGWWFDTGSVVKTRKLLPEEDIDAVVAELEHEYGGDKGYRYSMAPRGHDYDIQLGLSEGEDWPAVSPHYE